MKGFVYSLIVICSVLATGCGRSAPAPELPPITTDQVIELIAKDNYFGPQSVEAKAGAVAFILKNQGYVAHNLIIKDQAGQILGETPVISRNRSTHLQLELAPGTYELICTVPGHQTMTATLLVK